MTVTPARHLRLEAHIEHPVGLIENEVAAAVEVRHRRVLEREDVV